MRNDRQTYYSGNFNCAGNSYAAPVKALDKERGASAVIILAAILLVGVVGNLLISQIN